MSVYDFAHRLVRWAGERFGRIVRRIARRFTGERVVAPAPPEDDRRDDTDRPRPTAAHPVRALPRPSSVPTIALALVNYERGSRAAPRVALDPLLATTAESCCVEMAAAEHCGPVGSIESRVLAAGYVFERLLVAAACGQQTVRDVVRDWAADEANRAVIADPECRHFGFGLAIAADGRHYWVAVLARPAPPSTVGSPADPTVVCAPPLARGSGS